MGAHVISHAVQRAGVDPGEIDDVVMGAALQQGTQGFNLARNELQFKAVGLKLSEPGQQRIQEGQGLLVTTQRQQEVGDAPAEGHVHL